KFSSLSETEQFLQQSRIYVGFPKESLVENPPQKTLNDAVKELQKICNELGDKQGAIDDYTQAIKINPNYANAYYGRGFVRNELRDKQGAIDDFQQAAKLYQQQGKNEDYQDALNRIRKLQQ
ncbi:MAG: tetratricopeptide repeat protein, partial [Dolichospermum sp.]